MGPSIPFARSAWRYGAAFLVVAASIGLPAAPAAAEEAWSLAHEDAQRGIRVQILDRGDAPPMFRATARIDAPLGAFVAVLLDTGNMPRWVHRTREATVLSRNGPTAGVARVVTAMPWFLADRESLVDWRLRQDPESGVVEMEGRPAARTDPVPEGLVRMPDFRSRWQFRPLAEGGVEARFEGWADLGGQLSQPWVVAFVKSTLWESPAATMAGMQAMVADPAYRQARFDFIREPAP